MSQTETHTRRAIEEYFPIVEINRLAVPERNSFKPIYQMHKWFARRASCVFRAILLGCLKPAGTDIIAEFYKDHTHDPDTSNKIILDPFMGGGTTVVEALRLGCRVIGIDLNPVAWFIVKTEVEPVDIDALKDAFERLANRTVAWSGKPLRETLLEQYKTVCPCCGNEEADIIYTFWVKSAICTDPNCRREVPLHSDYIVAQKKPSIRYWRDARCPQCHKTFDWEVEPVTLIADLSLMREDARTSAGELRGNVRWAYSAESTVACPHCCTQVTPTPAPSRIPGKKTRKERKKVPLTVLLCPHCEQVWQWRGELPKEVTCPTCDQSYQPQAGNVVEKGKFVCPAYGTKDTIINSIRRLPPDQLLPMKPYAIQGYCAYCASGISEENEENGKLFDGHDLEQKANDMGAAGELNLLSKNGGKFFKRFSPADWARYHLASQIWEREKERLPYPKQEIPLGEKTKSGLLAHHYRYWHQMFNPRQLLCLATLLESIGAETDIAIQETLLGTFQYFLERQNVFTRFFNDRNTVQGSFDRHDFQPKTAPTENTAWGLAEWRGTFPNMFDRTLTGVSFLTNPFDLLRDGSSRRTHASGERIDGAGAILKCEDSANLSSINSASIDFVVTDPPYVGNVNYAELSDFFYVWLRQILGPRYSHFAPEQTPKVNEVIENPIRGKTRDDFERDLTNVFTECNRILKSDGLLAFTFHHAENLIWEIVLRSLMNAGFELVRAFPVHGEKESSTQLQATEGIAYDLIHICKRREPNISALPRSWAGIRQEIRRRAREEIRAIEAGRYGNEPLAPADVNIVLIGKCLELYSRHYGAVIDHEGRGVELHEALMEIRSMVDELVSREHPLPSELEEIDAASRLYLLALCGQREIKSDDVHKATRGVLEPDDLIAAGLMIKGRAKRGRTYEVKQPAERYRELQEKFEQNGATPQANLFGDELPLVGQRIRFIDYVHFLMGLVEAGENVLPWLERFRGQTPQLRAACEYLRQRNAEFAPILQKILGLIDPGPLFRS
jgi:putative DNA methylase